MLSYSEERGRHASFGPQFEYYLFLSPLVERGGRETAVCEVFTSVLWTGSATFGLIGYRRYEITSTDLNTDYRHLLVTELDFVNI